MKSKVLVIAEAANPEWTSVPLVGWSLASALRAVAQVHIVTQVRNRAAVLRAGLVEGVDFTAIDSEAIAAPLNKLSNFLRRGTGKGWTMAMAISAVSYPYFERLVWQQFGAAIKARDYDIVHRVTPLSPTVQSSLARKCAAAGVPFIMGPLNGGVPWPKGFDAVRRAEHEWLSYVRGVYKVMPGRGAMLASARVILCGSRHTQSEIPDRHAHKTVWLPENAIDPARFNLVAKQSLTPPIRAAFVGRLVPYKGAGMLLAAAADLLRAGQLELDIIGDGPERENLTAQAADLGIAQAVTFHGNLPHQQVQDVLHRANLFTFPSIREFGGGVVLEAMALGVVPVIVDYAGPGELVTQDEGYKIPIGNRAEIIAGLTAQLQEIVADPSDLPKLAKAGRTKVATYYTWAAKADQIRHIYDWIIRDEDTSPPQVVGNASIIGA